MNAKISIARLSVASNSLLIAMKLTVGLISGSISILSEAIHSLMDLLASVIAYFSVKISDTPADDNHPYGHGKFENVSGVIESILIFIAAFWIIYEAIHKLMNPEQKIGSLWLGIVVMAASALVNVYVSMRLYKVARETESIALEADALHLKTDVLTSAGVAVGLFLIWITGYHFLDPIVAILVACLILKESFNLFRRAYGPLLDVTLPEDELMKIRLVITRHCTGNISFHSLRTRLSGNKRYIDFHLNLAPEMTVKEAHDFCDCIENDIHQEIPNSEVTIHVENF
ncbi:MAG TPA: cation diffusion facilitator family transporter [Bacteroidales bacterium]|nr:cation diffusion facilitator family transporter [Bacteroidales bacterium]